MHKKTGFFAIIFSIISLGLLLIGCDSLFSEKSGTQSVTITGAAEWSSYSRLVISLYDDQGNSLDTLFDGVWTVGLGSQSFTTAAWKDGHPLVTRVDGYTDKNLVFQQESKYNGEKVTSRDYKALPLDGLAFVKQEDTTVTEGLGRLLVSATLRGSGTVTGLKVDIDGDGVFDKEMKGFWRGPTVQWILDSLNFNSIGTHTVRFEATCGDAKVLGIRKITVEAKTYPSPIKAFVIVGRDSLLVVSSLSKYLARVPFDSTKITLRVVPSDSQVTVAYTTNSQTLGPGVEWNLEVGENTVFAEAQRASGPKQTASLTVIRADKSASTSSALAALEVAGLKLNKVFDSTETEYSVEIPYDSLHVSLRARATSSGASVLLDGGRPLASVNDTSITLKVGLNTVKITVVAEDGKHEKTYTLTLIRAENDDASLKSLEVIAGGVSQAFNRNFVDSVPKYSVSIGPDITEFQVKAIAKQTGSQIKVNHQGVGAEGMSLPISVSEGGTSGVLIDVTSAAGTTKGYAINVTRVKRLVSLSGLVVTVKGNVIPFDLGFTPLGLTYKAIVGSEVDAIDITPEVGAGTFTITVAGNRVESKTTAKNLAVVFGTNLFSVVVKTATNDSAVYTVLVTRPKSGIKQLNDLTVKGAVLSPKLDSSNTSYSATLPYGLSLAEISLGLKDTLAHATLDDKPLANNVSTSSLIPEGGFKVFRIRVTAQDGGTKDLTLKVNRAASPVARYGALLSGSPADPTPLAGDYVNEAGVVVATRVSKGLYKVIFAGLGGHGYDGGNLIVTAVGHDSTTCSIREANGLGTDYLVTVGCYGTGDSLGTDSRFSLLLNWPKAATAGSNAFARTNNYENLNAALYAPDSVRAWNSSGGPQEAQWIGKVNGSIREGIYTHRFKGLSGGVLPALLLSPWCSLDKPDHPEAGHPGRRMAVASIKQDNGDLAVEVQGYNESGVLATSKFYIYAAYPEAAGGRAGGYAFISGRDVPKVESGQAWNSAGPSPTVTRSAVGQYQIIFPGLSAPAGFKGNMQVTKVGTSGGICKSEGHTAIGGNLVTQVSCWDKTGVLYDTQFTVYVTF